jgi:hypothetical protein
MACDRFVEAIRGRALGLTLPADAAAHLAVCEGCRTILDDEERVMAVIDSAVARVASTSPSPDFIARLREHVERSPRWMPSALLVPPAVAALALLLAAVVVNRLPSGRTGVQQTSANRSVEPPPAASSEPTAHTAPNTAAAAAKRRVLVPRQKATRPARVHQAPEILVPAQQREAIDRLFASARAGRPEVISMLTNAHGGESGTGAPVVVVEPLRIEPVVVPALAALPSIDNK